MKVSLLGLEQWASLRGVLTSAMALVFKGFPGLNPDRGTGLTDHFSFNKAYP